MPTRALRLALAAIGGCTGAMLAYALLRVGQKLVYGDPDPALVIWSEHAGYFWRSWTSAYVGGMVAFAVWLASTRNAERTARVLKTGLTVAALALAAQGMLVP